MHHWILLLWTEQSDYPNWINELKGWGWFLNRSGMCKEMNCCCNLPTQSNIESDSKWWLSYLALQAEAADKILSLLFLGSREFQVFPLSRRPHASRSLCLRRGMNFTTWPLGKKANEGLYQVDCYGCCPQKILSPPPSVMQSCLVSASCWFNFSASKHVWSGHPDIWTKDENENV